MTRCGVLRIQGDQWQGRVLQMRASLIALGYFAYASMVFAALGPSNQMGMSRDVLLVAFLHLGFADLYQVSYVSKGFRSPADQAMVCLYCIQHGQGTFLDYTRVLCELDALVQSVAKDGDISRASTELGSSPHFACIRSVLQAKFGYCIRYASGKLPKFSWRHVPLDVLDDRHGISVLPYVLDRMSCDGRRMYFIQGLLELGRFDLLSRLKFTEIDDVYFYELASILLPEPVMVAAAKPFQKNTLFHHTAKLIALTILGGQATKLPKHFQVPIYMLRYLHEKSMVIPEDLALTGGLDDSSMSFWMYLLTKKAEGAEELLRVALKHGDGSTKRLARAFYEPVAFDDLGTRQKIVYQSVLIRFRFSCFCNDQIIQNYGSMLEGLSQLHYRTLCAFLDCGQSKLIASYAIQLSDDEMEAVLCKMCRLKDDGTGPLIERLFRHFSRAPELLKHMVQRKADGLHMQLAWNSVQAPSQLRFIAVHCCSIPLVGLEGLLFEQHASLDAVQGMVDGLRGNQWPRSSISREAHVLYTVMFWEAAEEVIGHLLDLVPSACKLRWKPVFTLLLLTKYSAGLCTKLVRRLEKLHPYKQRELIKFRPDLAAELEAKTKDKWAKTKDK